MKSYAALVLFCTVFVAIPLANCQPHKRIAVLPAGGYARNLEQNLVNELTTILVNGGDVEIVDREKLQEIKNEMRSQHDGSFDIKSAVETGRLLGVPTFVFIRVDDYRSTKRDVRKGSKTTTYGNVSLKATAQILSVETAAIISAPTASFNRENQELSESDTGRGSQTIGPIPIPGRPPVIGPDAEIALKKLSDAALNSVVGELAPKILRAAPASAVQRPPQKQPKVAGVQDGLTFLNAGATAGLKIGDTYQISRMVDSGMQDPDTQKPIMRKKQVCLLTISEVEDSLSSGKCKGELAQNGDLAIRSAE